jgi:CDP-diglyceride synthetase
MFKQRLISGIILVLIAFVTLYYGGFLTFFVVGAISLIGVFELLRVIQMEKSALGVIVYTGSVLYYLSWIGTVCNATGIISIDFAYCSVRFYFSKV